MFHTDIIFPFDILFLMLQRCLVKHNRQEPKEMPHTLSFSLMLTALLGLRLVLNLTCINGNAPQSQSIQAVGTYPCKLSNTSCNQI